MKQAHWDELETALLLDYYIKVSENKITKAEAVSELSLKLRNKAISEGQVIDDIYRNENGINIQFESMKFAFTGDSGLKHTSKLFREVAALYKSNPDEFASLLTRSQRLCYCILLLGTVIA